MKKTAKVGSDGKGNGLAVNRTEIREALKDFLGLEANGVLAFAYGLCRDQEEAGELVQEASYRALKGGKGYEGSRPLKNWFLTILRNAFVDSRRRAERRKGCSLDYWDDASGERREREIPDHRTEGSLDRLERAETARIVRRAMRRLPTIHREVLLLCDAEDTSYKTAAKLLGVPLGTLRSRLARARAALRRTLVEFNQGR